jgi:pyridoxamine 5'-phosphate oxidase
LVHLPDEPVALFAEWLDVAIERGVPEPHAMTLATVDDAGLPDARTLILKSVDSQGWAFASQLSSRKGTQLRARPVAAADVWWQPIARAVRLRGPVIEASRQESEADLAARSAAARAGVDPADWTLWRLQPQRVEFWQAASDRRHLRITYDRSGSSWSLRVRRGEAAAQLRDT